MNIQSIGNIGELSKYGGLQSVQKLKKIGTLPLRPCSMRR